MAGLTAMVLPATAAAAPTAPISIEVLSGRADLVSGGDALVRITVPSGQTEGLRADVEGRDVSSAFTPRTEDTLDGLLIDLEEGENVLTVRIPGNGAARLTLTNHPITGPLFSGPQSDGFRCATQQEGLGASEPPFCHAPTKVEFWYLPKVNTSTLRPIEVTENRGFLPYDPASPPSDATIATTTTDQGVTVPFIVRMEKGVINRSIYWITVLAAPAEPIDPSTPPTAWNSKLLYHFNGGYNPSRSQARPDIALSEPAWGHPLDAEVLGRGFAKAMSTLNVFGTNTNDVVSAETMMMVKERVVTSLGPVRSTIGNGCSGGSMQQHLIVGAYPGLLDGIMPMCSYPDAISVASDIADCTALTRYFRSNPSLTALQQAAVYGQQTGSECISWSDAYALDRVALDPTFGCFPFAFAPDAPLPSGAIAEPEATRDFVPSFTGMVGRGEEPDDIYDPDGNPDGLRCTVHDDMVNIFGTRDIDGFANRPYDNVGIQYGLQALNRQAISADEFLDLNRNVGGFDIDGGWQPERTQADLEGLVNAYRTGRITDGRGHAEVPILDYRGTSNAEIHADSRTYMMQARLQAANGHADNQVIWNSDVVLVGSPAMNDQTLPLMDRWVAAIDADDSSRSEADKVVRNKPADAQDACWLAEQRIDEPNVCAAALPHYEQPRIVAGGPVSNDVLKCHLKPLNRQDYLPDQFTDAQWGELQAVFPDGVCDWSEPGVGQQAAMAWLTYQDVDGEVIVGGEPLGPAPTSEPVGRRAEAADRRPPEQPRVDVAHERRAAAPVADGAVSVASSPLPATGSPLSLAFVGLAAIGAAASLARPRR